MQKLGKEDEQKRPQNLPQTRQFGGLADEGPKTEQKIYFLLKVGGAPSYKKNEILWKLAPPKDQSQNTSLPHLNENHFRSVSQRRF